MRWHLEVEGPFGAHVHHDHVGSVSEMIEIPSPRMDVFLADLEIHSIRDPRDRQLFPLVGGNERLRIADAAIAEAEVGPVGAGDRKSVV